MKVLHVLMGSLPDISGYAIRSQEILVAQRRLGLEVCAITSPYQKQMVASGNQSEVIQGIRYYRTNLWKTPQEDGKRSLDHFVKKYLLWRHFKREIARVCQIMKPDLIHGHSYFYSGYPASRVAQTLGVPFVYELRGLIQDSGASRSKFKESSLQYQYIDYMERKTMKSAVKVVTISRPLVEYVQAQGLSHDKVALVPNGVDTTRFCPIPKDDELIQKYQLSNKVTLGFIGSFFAFEGLEFLLKGFHKIVSEERKVLLFLVGAGEMTDQLKRLTRELNLQDSVIFTGKVSHSDILRYYSVIDIFLYPRLKEKLTEIVTPLKPLEAMAMGKAVVGSDVGGLRELIDDGNTGLLFKAGELEGFVSICLQLIRDQELRRILGIAAKDRMVQERDWLKLAERYRTLYNSLIIPN